MTFIVQIESSGREMTVASEETILTAALRHNIAIPYGCRSGICGACKATLVSGEVTYGPTLPAALTPAEQKAGSVILCQAQPRSDLRLQIRTGQPTSDIPVQILPCRVAQKELMTPEVLRLFLKIPSNERFLFLPGQYIEFILPDQRHRAFSLANAPHDEQFLELHVRHIQGGSFTTWLFQEMTENTLLRIQGPLGSFTFQKDSPRPVILIAGGTGFAPIKSILEYAFAAGIERPFHLYWAARTRPELYLNELPQHWTEQYPHFRYTPVLSRATAADAWAGRTGRVQNAVVADYPNLARYEVYACGPPPLVGAARETLVAAGLPRKYYYADAFEYAKDSIAPTST